MADTSSSRIFLTGAITLPGPTIGNGPDTLSIAVSQDAWLGSAQFIVDVNGSQIGAIQTVDPSVRHNAGGSEIYLLKGNFASITGSDKVSIKFINDAYGGSPTKDRNLYVNSVSLDGVPSPTPATSLLRDGASNFTVAAPIPSGPINLIGPATGSGPDTASITVSQDAWQGSAQFVVDVNGTQIGGVQTVDASVLHNASGTETYSVMGNFSNISGSDKISVSFINDAYGGSPSKDRNLYVDKVSLDGIASPTPATPLWSNGTANFTVAAPKPPPTPAPAPPPPGVSPWPSTLPIPSATALTVGAQGEYKSLAAAAQHAVSGDTIYVQAGTYTNDFVSLNGGSGSGITLQAVGGMVNEVATVAPPNEKALLDVSGNVTVNGFAFSGVAISNYYGGNGAGIRYENGNLTLNSDYIHNNQDGLLGNPAPAGTITINNSAFVDNGSGSGRTHNIYIGDIQQATITNSLSTGANLGHEFKSRAQNTTIINSRLQDVNGNASYVVDTPNGGQVILIGDTIQKGPNAPNQVMVTTGEEGAYANSHLFVTGNELINNRSSAIGVRNDGASATLAGNAVYGLTAAQLQQGGGMSVTGNTLSPISAAPALNASQPFTFGSAPSPSILAALNTASPAAGVMMAADLQAASLSPADISSSSQAIASAMLGGAASASDVNSVAGALADYITNMRTQPLMAATLTA